mmetsp:Transcript_29966/g.29174  ORF Transcript_29966/g.29174 Transcript_29966/m.29174 type:complete len:111 (+) Transcript_29966:688-1020(+)
MLGGTIVGEGEESADVGMGQYSSQTQFKRHFIYLSEIDKIFALSNYMVIIKKNQEIEKFIFKTEEKMREVINLIKKNHRDHFKTSLYYYNFQPFEQDKLLTEIDFLIKNQ